MAFSHVENSLYLGGGYLDGEYFSKFRKIFPTGEITELHEIPSPKSYFATALWSERNTLFTLGGLNGSELK